MVLGKGILRDNLILLPSKTILNRQGAFLLNYRMSWDGEGSLASQGQGLPAADHSGPHSPLTGPFSSSEDRASVLFSLKAHTGTDTGRDLAYCWVDRAAAGGLGQAGGPAGVSSLRLPSVTEGGFSFCTPTLGLAS